MNNVIQPTIVLLILSLITEKIANFFKLHYEPLANKKELEIDEKVREKHIQLVTIIVGVIVALISKANLFDFFKDKFNLFWTEEDFKGIAFLSNIIGSIISGLFLSISSKFFHDLIDMLLQSKNLKRKLNDKANWESKNIETFDNYIKEDESKRIENSLLPYKSKLMQIENVVCVSSVLKNDKPLLQVHVNGEFSLENLIPKKIFYSGKNNSQKEVLVNIIHDFEPTSHATIYPSSKLSNANPYTNNTGSMGGRVFDETTNEEYFVSCYHVVKSPNHNWDNFQPIGNETIIDISDNNSSCGLIINAIRDDEVDIAIMKPINDYEINGTISGIGTPYFTRILNDYDKKQKTKVRMNGMVSGFNVGSVIDINLPVKITYIDGSINQLNKMIFIQALSNGTFSQPGDSGSFIIDEYNYLIGVLVGGFQNVSYVIPINTIFKKTNTKIARS
jgi:hypothetical protein